MITTRDETNLSNVMNRASPLSKFGLIFRQLG